MLTSCLHDLSKHDLKQVSEGTYRNLNSAFSERTYCTFPRCKLDLCQDLTGHALCSPSSATQSCVVDAKHAKLSMNSRVLSSGGDWGGYMSPHKI